jgi:hypothetical protein
MIFARFHHERGRLCPILVAAVLVYAAIGWAPDE